MSIPSIWLSSIEMIQANRVFARLTRHSRWPSPRTTVWLFVAALLVGIGSAVALLVVDPSLNTPLAQLITNVIALSGLAVALLSPPVAALVTVIATVTDVQSEAYELMRVSLLPREEIVSGYLYAALYRLRLLWVLALGLLPPPVAILLAGDILLDASTDGIPIMVVLAAPAVWLISVAVGVAVNWLAVCIAVWQALCWKRVGIASINTLAMLGVMGGLLSCASCPALTWVTSIEVGGAVAVLICCLIYFLHIIGYALPALTKAIRKKAEGCI